MIDKSQIRNILIIAPNWIGDAVLAVPAISHIRNIFPSAHISILAIPHISELFQESPYVDEIRSPPPYPSPYTRSWGEGKREGVCNQKSENIRNLLTTANDIRKCGFDIAILFPNSFRSALITYLANIPNRCGYNRDGRGFMLNMPIKVDSQIKKLHQAEYYLNIANSIMSLRGGPEQVEGPTKQSEQVGNDKVGNAHPTHNLWGINPHVTAWRHRIHGSTDKNTWSWLFLSKDEIKQAAETLLKNHITPDDIIVGINPGAAYGSAKRWYPERFAVVSKLLVEKYNAKIIVFGSKQEMDMTEQIVSISQSPILNMAGKTSIRELMAMIKGCRVFITNDSGPMHIAASLGVPVVAIFGSTDPARTGPLGDQHIVIKKDIECSPCFLRKCYTDLLCMDLISVDDVLQGVKMILKSNE